MPEKKRIESIDIMRGLTLFLMLFVNDLFVRGVPSWLVHTEANFDGMGLADWVFPGFLFMVGMSVPFAIRSRIKKGHSKGQVSLHILIRTASLLIIGVLMLNSGRLNPELSGINKQLWAILMYVSIFLVWNNYPSGSNLKILFGGLRFSGIVILIFLIYKFRAGTIENPSWLVTSWWGILGLIGWGYFAAAFSYLLIGDRLGGIIAVWLFFTVLNILSQLGELSFFNPVKPALGVLIGGNTPSIVVAGIIASLIFQKLKQSGYIKIVWVMLLLGIIVLATGFLLRNWFIISKIKATPSWAMICNGISLIVFAVIFLITDIWEKSGWAAIFKWVGQNSLTTYLAPDLVYYAIWGIGIPLFFYKQDSSQILAVAGSLGWAFLMVLFSVLLSKLKIQLKL